MVQLFRQYLPADVYRMMMIDYYDLRGILGRMAEGNTRLAALKRDASVTDLILSLMIFYRHVIAQFEGANRVMQRMHSSEIRVVRIGKYTLDAAAVDSMDTAIRQFYGLVAEYQVPREILVQHDVREFATALAAYLKVQE